MRVCVCVCERESMHVHVRHVHAHNYACVRAFMCGYIEPMASFAASNIGLFHVLQSHDTLKAL